MLIGFSFKNFASFRQETVFSMLASKGTEYIETNSFEYGNERLLKSALIYGPNGSGKTNWIKALKFMQQMVFRSVIDKNMLKKNDTFKFYDKSNLEETMFEVSFIQSGIIYEYGFSILNEEIVEEWLYRKIKRRSLLFKRNSPDWKDIKLYGEMKKAEKIKDFTRKDSLFLTAATMFNIQITEDISEWFSNLYILGGNFNTPALTLEYMENSNKNKNKILEQLKIADLGIQDFTYKLEDLDVNNDHLKSFNENIPENIKVDINVKRRSFDLNTNHYIYDNDKNKVSDIELPFEKYQSKGTIKLFEILGPILDTLEGGKILIIDEIDSRLHSGIVTYILGLFNSIDRNPKNGQLICNTHNILLLDEEIRRDQVWFIQKDKYGESELYCLDDFKDVRKDDLKLKKYLLGVYGAIPSMKRSGVDG